MQRKRKQISIEASAERHNNRCIMMVFEFSYDNRLSVSVKLQILIKSLQSNHQNVLGSYFYVQLSAVINVVMNATVEAFE